jgi:hypothetical protein
VRVFNFSLVEKVSAAAALNRSVVAAYSVKRHATFRSRCALGCTFSKRIAVVDNGNIDVGNKSATRKPGQPVENLANGSPELRIDKRRTPQLGACGAMSQQSCDSGHQSAPQKFVQLVGCRDPKVGSDKARPQPWVRPAPAKR